MRKPSNTLLEAMDQMEQIPGIAGAWSEVRCQTHHTKPMRKTDWAFITSSGWLYVNTEREASCPEWVYILSHCCLHLALGHIREDRKTDAVWEHACDCIVQKCCWISGSEDHRQSLPKRHLQTRKRKQRSIIGCWSIRLPRLRDFPQ